MFQNIMKEIWKLNCKVWGQEQKVWRNIIKRWRLWWKEQMLEKKNKIPCLDSLEVWIEKLLILLTEIHHYIWKTYDKIRNQYNGNKTQITLLIEYDMNQETSIIQYTSIKMWRKGCQNYQKMFQFMLHWRRIKFDCCKFWVG